MGQLASTITQIFPPRPTFLEKDVPNLHDKVCIVTGANTGVGKELARMLYAKDAKVYIASRSREKSEKAIEEIRHAHPSSKGQLHFLRLDLNDLSTIKASAAQFLAAEARLHVLFNNAGLQTAVPHAQTAQGYEKHLGVNTIGPFLFTRLLTPALAAAAAARTTTDSPEEGSVRVVWVASSGTELGGVQDTAVDLNNIDYRQGGPPPKSWLAAYSLSKAGNWLHGVEYARRHRADGVVSVALNPGNLRSELYRESALGPLLRRIVRWLMYPPVDGAYTQLFAGFSPEISLENTGCWVIPFGRIREIRKDLKKAMKTEAEGGNGAAQKFYDWTEEQVKPYM